MNQKVIEKFWNLLGKDRVLVDEPMKRHTTFRIGGPADFFLLPSTVDEEGEYWKYAVRRSFPILYLEMEVTCW